MLSDEKKVWLHVALTPNLDRDRLLCRLRPTDGGRPTVTSDPTGCRVQGKPAREAYRLLGGRDGVSDT